MLTAASHHDLDDPVAHQRKIIRHAVVDLLTKAGTSAGTRVQATRLDPHKKSELPAISVYTMREPVAPASAEHEPRELTREVEVEISGWVAHSDAYPVDDAMDDLAEQIEAAMDGDRFIGGAAAESILESTELAIQGEGAPLIGIVTLTYTVTYRTSPAAPELDDFTRVGVTHRIVGTSDDNAAHDTFVVQEPQ
jgi:hypothetical protein